MWLVAHARTRRKHHGWVSAQRAALAARVRTQVSRRLGVLRVVSRGSPQLVGLSGARDGRQKPVRPRISEGFAKPYARRKRLS
jgi:hypothetical protein